MTPSELKRHVATITRVLGAINVTQAGNAGKLGANATDIDELQEWVNEDGGLGESIWITIEEVLEAVEAVSEPHSRRACDCRVALRSIEAIYAAFGARATRTILPPRPALRLVEGGLAPQSAPRDMAPTVPPPSRKGAA